MILIFNELFSTVNVFVYYTKNIYYKILRLFFLTKETLKKNLVKFYLSVLYADKITSKWEKEKPNVLG